MRRPAKDGFPIKSPALRSHVIRFGDQCPECGGDIDTGWECNNCGFDARDIAYKPAIRALDRMVKP